MTYTIGYENLGQILQNRKNDFGVTFIDKDKEEFLGYYDLLQESLGMLAHLQKQGAKPKDEVIIQLTDNKQFVMTFWACILGGFTVIPLAVGKSYEQWKVVEDFSKVLNDPYFCTTQEIEQSYVILWEGRENDDYYEHIKKKMLFVEERESTVAEAIVYEAGKDDVAFIQFSSGSTGVPKGVKLSHENLIADAKCICDRARFYNKILLSWLPLSHNFGLIACHIAPVLANVNQHLMATDMFLANPLTWMDKANEKRVNLLFAPNFAFQLIVNCYSETADYGWDLSCVESIFNGAEPISLNLCKQFNETLGKNKLRKNVIRPSYGLAEATVGVCVPHPGAIDESYLDRNFLSIGNEVKYLPRGEGSLQCVSLGEALDCCQIRITDDAGNILAQNHIGNIEIEGNIVCKGYYNNEKLTKEIFTEDNWLKTGDIGLLKNNQLIITGRKKETIIINGKNYYPLDIENNVRAILKGAYTQVLACGSMDTEERREDLIIFILYNDKIEHFLHVASLVYEGIAKLMGIRVKDVIPVTEFHKTVSGKIRRFKMVKDYQNGVYQDVLTQLHEEKDMQKEDIQELEEVNQVEKELLQIWKEVLEAEQIMLSDNFFEIGGQSVKAAMLVAKINSHFGTDIKIVHIFEQKTIKQQAELIQEKTTDKTESIEVLEEKEYYSTSSQQKRMYLLSKMQGGGIVYNIPVVIRITGTVDQNSMKKSFKKIVRRHECLRTCFKEVDGEIVQVIKKDVEVSLGYIQLQDGENINSIIKKNIHSFDLKEAPLIRMNIFHVSHDEEYLLLEMHHIISDGTSCGIIVRDLFEYYKGNELTDQKITYKDYAAWQQILLESDELQAQKAYWFERLSNQIPILNLPTDYVRPTVQDMKGERIQFTVETEVLDSLKKLMKDSDSTLYMVLLSAFQVLLYKLSGQEDIIVGSPVTGRNHSDVSNLVGLFVNTLAIRSIFSKDMTFKSFLEQVKTNVISAMDNSDYQIEDIINDLKIQRDRGSNPLYDVMFTLQNMNIPKFEINNQAVSGYEGDSGVSKFDLTLYATEEDAELHCEMEYAYSLFKKETVEKFIHYYQMILKTIIEQPDIILDDFSLVEGKEKEELLQISRAGDTDYGKEKVLSQHFEEQADRYPDKIAVKWEGGQITYRELNEKSNQLAWELRKKGVKADVLVALYVQRDIEMQIGILGILKAGGAYVPIDLAAPKQRSIEILQDSSIKLFLADKQTYETGREYLEGSDVELLMIEADGGVYQQNSKENLEPVHTSSNYAYVIYTSGSTGKPKGNLTRQYSITRVVKNTNYIEIRPEDNLLQLSNYAFDGSTFDIFGSLLNGATLVLVKKELLLDVELLSEVIINEKISIFFVTTALFNTLVDVCIKCLKNIRKILFGGERVSREHVEKAYQYLGKDKIIHVYGPTESTVFATYYPVNEIDKTSSTIPIGRPISNTEVYILDNKCRLQPFGVPGEVLVAGDGLIEGYLNREDLTKEKFIRVPEITNRRLYRTGDLARWLPNGNIEFMDRIDSQVKIRGFRIELGEIENQLMRQDGIVETVVIPIKEQNMNLAAYYTCDKEIDLNVVKADLKKKLPPYMIPIYYIKMDKLPLTMNGKIDKKKLPLPATEMLEDSYVEASTGLEKKILEVWEELLHLNKISVYDNFFDIGGNSLLVIRMHKKLQSVFGEEIKVTDIFANPSIKQLAALVASKQDHQTGVTIKSYVLPNSYLADQAGTGIRQELTCRLSEQVVQKLNQYRGDIALTDVMMVSTLCLLYKITGDPELECCLLEKGEVIRISKAVMESKMKFNKILSDISGTDGEGIQVQYLDIATICKDSKQYEADKARILWCTDTKRTDYFELLKVYNMIFQVEESREGIYVKCIYDGIHFKQNELMKMINMISVIATMVLEDGDE